MPYISLTATERDNHYGSYQTELTEVRYPHSNLFIKYRHKPIVDLGYGNIALYIKRNHFRWTGGPHVTLKLDGLYSNRKLFYEEVYFNRFEKKTPLILVLIFNETASTPNRYYVLTDIKNDINRSKTIGIGNLPVYNKDSDILTSLLKENDKLTNFLTFDISKKVETGKEIKYNEGRITVKKLIELPVNKYRLVELENTVVRQGYVIYRHEPVDEHIQSPSCFIYQNQVLMGRENGSPVRIYEIQNKKYNVIVYHADGLSEPLLLEFDKRDNKSSGEDNLYYIRKRDRHGVHFEKLRNTTKELLDVSSFKHVSVHNILKLNTFKSLIGLLNIIIERIHNAIIYRLDKNHNDHPYEARTIIVIKENIAEPSISKRRHKPTNDYSNKTQLLYYKGLTINLVPNSSISPETAKLETLNNKRFSEIVTYALSDHENEHLLIKITEKGGKNYYLHRFNKKGDKWRQVGIHFLKDAGIQVDVQNDENLDKKLDELLNEKSKSSNVKLLLDYISFSVNSIIILLHEKSGYDQSKIKPLTENEIPSIDLENRVFVNSDTVEGMKCINIYNYKVYKHHTNELGTVDGKKTKESNLYVRLYLHNKRLSFYDSKASGNQIYLKYNHSNKFINVYYYGDKDPRPLLLCYDGNAYRPHSVAEYESKWFKEEKPVKCECQSDGISQELATVISKVVGLLNEVKLEERLSEVVEKYRDPEIKTRHYTVQEYNAKSIKVGVTYDKRQTLGLYRHEPNDDGYRLGTLKYESSSPESTGLEYDLNLQLKCVSVFFPMSKFKYPFLVELEFKKDGLSESFRDYYYLEAKDVKKWTKMDIEFGSKDFLVKIKELEQKERAAMRTEEKGKVAVQVSSGDSDTQSNLSKTQPTLIQTPTSTVQEKLPSEKESSSSAVPGKPTVHESPPLAKPTDGLSSQNGRSENITPEISSSKEPKSEMPSPKQKTPHEFQNQESGHHPRGQASKDNYLQPEVSGKGLHETAAATLDVHTQQIDVRDESRQTLDQRGSSILSEERYGLIERHVQEMEDKFDTPSKVGTIAGGTASGGVGLAGSVVGYLTYARYCKP